jgi:hypothetical protein
MPFQCTGLGGGAGEAETTDELGIDTDCCGGAVGPGGPALGDNVWTCPSEPRA